MTTTTTLDLEAFARGYLTCAAWLALPLGDDGEDYGEVAWYDHLAGLLDYRNGEATADYVLSIAEPYVLAELTADAKAFADDNRDDLAAAAAIYGAEQAGHDYFLTRNGHGAGYWDGALPAELGRRLTDATCPYGERTVVLCPDGDGWTVDTW